MKEKDKQVKYKAKNKISNFSNKNYNLNERVNNIEHKIDKYEFTFKNIYLFGSITIFIIFSLLGYIAVDFKNDINKDIENIKQEIYLKNNKN